MRADVGQWPLTRRNGPSGQLDRLVTSTNVARNAAPGAAANQPEQDYPSTGAGAWRGPYLDAYSVEDPWGRAYVINARYFPGGRYAGKLRHRVMVLSAGPDGLWETPFSDGTSEESPLGDDIGFVITTD